MFSAQSLTLAAVLLLAVAIRSGEGIQCWVCSSDQDRRCLDPFNTTHLYLHDCDRDRSQSTYLSSKAVCKKLKQKVNNEVIVSRSCNWESSDQMEDGPCPLSTSSSSYVKIEHCSVCSVDGCNGAQDMKITVVHGMLPLAGALVVSRFLR